MKTKPAISLFGTYENSQLYSRNISLENALRSVCNNLTIFRPNKEVHIDKANAIGSMRLFLKAIYKILKQWISLSKYAGSIRKQDIIIVPYPPHADALLLQLLLIRKHPIVILDSFLGLHDTVIEDRQLFNSDGLIAKLIYYWEKYILSSADIALLDTKIQCKRLASKYNLPTRKFVSLPVGIDESIWSKTSYPEIKEEFLVLFWGTFIPLHGIATIVDAAIILENTAPEVKFKIIGKGQTAPLVKRKLQNNWPKNLTWIEDIIPITKLADYAKKAHCILGIFGTSEKAGSVIPYKVCQALALNRPVITRKSNAYESDPALYSIHTIEPDSPIQLADKIQYVISNTHNYLEQPSTPRQYYDQYLSQNRFRERLISIISEINND